MNTFQTKNNQVKLAVTGICVIVDQIGTIFSELTTEITSFGERVGEVINPQRSLDGIGIYDE